MEHSSSCEHETLNESCAEDAEKRQQLQARIDDLLAGKVYREERGYRGTFAPFVSDDKLRAGALAAYWGKVAKRIGGLEGLTVVVDHMYECLEDDSYKIGMVEHAVMVFLTHSALARQHLVMRSLEERQPGMVKASCRSNVAAAPTVSGPA